MSWWSRPAPVEPSAVERVTLPVSVVDPSACWACHTPELPSTTVLLPGYGETRVCAHPKPCIERAQAFGIWKSPGGSRG